jgi:hypothetical protein
MHTFDFCIPCYHMSSFIVAPHARIVTDRWQIPVDTVSYLLPVVAPGDETLVVDASYAPVYSRGDAVGRASWFVPDPLAWEWEQALWGWQSCCHISDNDLSRWRASAALGQKVLATADHLRTRHDACAQKLTGAPWVLVPEHGCTVATLRRLKIKQDVITCDTWTLDGLARIQADMCLRLPRMDVGLCAGAARCYRRAWLTCTRDNVFLCGMGRNDRKFTHGCMEIDRMQVCVDAWEALMRRRKHTQDEILMVERASVHGVINTTCLDVPWPELATNLT